MKGIPAIAGAAMIAVAVGAMSVVGLATGTSRTGLAGVNPAHFTSKVDNPYFPWRPGTHFHYRSSKPAGTTNPVYASHRTKLVVGVRCRVVRDIVKEKGRRGDDEARCHHEVTR
jgi:hypothetical protein